MPEMEEEFSDIIFQTSSFGSDDGNNSHSSGLLVNMKTNLLGHKCSINDTSWPKV